MTSKAKLFILVNILSVIKVSLLETVHFTNSPNKLRKATNYTTYKVEVPNGDPITIIEANQPLIDGKFDELESAGKYSAHRTGDRRKQVMELESTLSMTVTPNRNYEYENSAAAAAAASAGDEESVTNDNSNLSHERNHKRNTMMKTVYSPELLQKFLKDYASKIHNAGSASIEAVPSHNHHHQQFNSGSVELEQASENTADERDKYASIETGDDDDANAAASTANEEGNRRVSSANSEGDEKESGELNDIQQRKNYRPNGSNHPYNKNNGWVTLDAVPWSKSKVSKWHSNVKRYGSSQGNYNFQNGNNYGARPSPYRPSGGSGGYDYDYNQSSGGGGNNDNDDYYSSRPSRPTFHNNQYYGPNYQANSRPPPPPPPPQPPQDNYYQSSHHHSSSSLNSHEYDRPSSHGRPEIITDNRPSNFPTHGEENHHHHHHHRPSYGQRPSYQHENAYHGGNYHSYKENSHPQTYPHNGEGEWVLVSTTKGYQFPKRTGQRAISFAAQNGFSDNKGIITAAGSQRVESLSRPHRSGPTKMSQQQMKLTVLPLFVNGEQQGGNHNNQQHYNDIDMSVYKPQTYGGLIETAQSNQTVEESAANANSEASPAPTMAASKGKKKRKVMKNYLMRKSSAGGADGTAMIAAVGASLLPASLGLIAPMVLG